MKKTALIAFIFYSIFYNAQSITDYQNKESPKVMKEGQDTMSQIKKYSFKESKEVLLLAEYMPEPSGGMSALYSYIKSNIKYPVEVTEQGISGKSFISITVETDGSLSDIYVARSLAGCIPCDEESIRLIKTFPAGWVAGKQNGEYVRVKYVIPITFTRG